MTDEKVTVSDEKDTSIVEDIKLDLSPQEMLSPSSINLYMDCPRAYFYRYIAKIKPPKNIHMVKGNVVHTALENFFEFYESDLDDRIMKVFNLSWKAAYVELKDLGLDDDEKDKAKKDCFNMLISFLKSFKTKMEGLVEAEKAENSQHAFYLLRPKFRELYLEDEDLRVRGYLDRVHESYDGTLTIADYKTSGKYGVGIPEKYRRQLAIYSLLYKRVEDDTPDYAAINFLRYGEENILEVTPSLLKYAEDTIDFVYSRTRSSNIGDYPMGGPDGSPCRWCPHIEVEDEKSWNDIASQEDFEKLAWEHKKDED